MKPIRQSRQSRAKAQAAIALCLALLAVIALSVPRPLRLHIIANSDSAQDQAVKLQVRDALLNQMQTQMSSATTKADAREALLANGGTLQAAADGALAQAGVPYGAQLILGESEFPDRMYGDREYPAGTYDALRVVLGNGEGRNWWCVMYPPLCIGKLKPAGEVKFKSALLSLFEKGRESL